MQASNGTVITYNGEIYNYIELREELSATGASARPPTPSAFWRPMRRWGDGLCRDLRGMFAFAIWDERQRRLFAARDRFGIKPFYYAVVDDMLYFASEAKALLTVSAGDRDRPGRAGRVSDVPVHYRRAHALQGRDAAAARPFA